MLRDLETPITEPPKVLRQSTSLLLCLQPLCLQIVSKYDLVPKRVGSFPAELVTLLHQQETKPTSRGIAYLALVAGRTVDLAHS